MFPVDFLADAPVVRSAIGAGLGLIAGSFLATILIRWPQGRSVLTGRSACDSCGGPLAARDLMPVLSFLAARGRCRRCTAAIDRRHPAVELAAAFIGGVALYAHPGAAGLITALLGWWLLLIAALDAQDHWLPDALTLPLIPAGLMVGALGFGPDLQSRLIGATAGFATLAGIALAYRLLRGREGMGGGDPKLLAALGAWLGWAQLPLVLLGAGLLGVSAILLAMLRGRPLKADDRLPLGTLMALAAWPLWLLTAR